MRRFLFFLFVLVGLACANDDEIVVVKRILESATLAEQATIGQELTALTEQYWTLLDRDAHAGSYAYLDRLFELLVVHPDLQRRTDFDWRLHLIEDDLAQEAFGFPGGQVYVTTGLLSLLESEDQLLAVLAHEMGYLDSDIAADRLIAEKAVGGDKLGDLVIGRTPDAPQDLLTNIRRISYDPNTVAVADSVMLDLLCPFNYRPTGLADIYKLADTQGDEPLWLQRRARPREARLDWLTQAGYVCGLNGVRNAAAYARFLEGL